MRKSFFATLLLAGLLAVFVETPLHAAVAVTVSISTFHDTLAPYGRWIPTSRYGEVWIPAGIAVGWEPYWDGEWIWTDYGWTWVSYDPWGDIPCHYGTWVWADPYGWVWVPGTVWAPAWVTWAWTDDYIGWAPVPPTLDINVSGYSGPPLVLAASRYVFVPSSRFVGVNVQTVRVATTQNTVLLSRCRKATRFAVSGGIVRATADPPLNFVQRAAKKRIERASIDRVKARPTTLAAAHISGRRVGVVAPARERDAAIKQATKRVGKVPAAPAAATSRTTMTSKTAREAHSNKSRSGSSRVAAKPSGTEMKSRGHVAQGDHGNRSPQQTARSARSVPSGPESHREAVHRQSAHAPSPATSKPPAEHAGRSARSSPAPAAAAKPRSSGAERPATSAREERRVAMSSHAAPPPASAAPPREPSRETARPPAAPQAHANRPAPQPAARAESKSAQPQPHPAKEKEKEKGRE